MSTIKQSRGLESPQFAQRKRRRMITVGTLLFLSIASYGASAVLFLNLPLLQIKEIVVVEAESIPSEMIKEIAQKTIDTKYFNIISKSNIFFYPKKEIETSLASAFKAIENISIKRESFSEIGISIKEKAPAALVCSGFRDDESDCYFSDEHGYVYGKAGSGHFSEYNYFYVPDEKGEITIGENFIPDGKFAEIRKFLKGVADGGLSPSGVLVGENGNYEMYLSPETTVYFDDRMPIPTTLSNLLAFWQDALKATSTPAFNYIDLRFGNSIYYSKE